MKTVCVIGHFAFGCSLLNGQTIKTKIVADEIEKKVGKGEIVRIDTHGGLLKLLKLPFYLLFSIVFFRNIVILPAQNGVRLIVPFLVIFNLFLRKKLHYAVVGGWMPLLIKDKPFLQFCLKKFRGIYVETTVMKNALEKLNFSNIAVLRNCKSLNILSEGELKQNVEKPIKFCIFSRIMKQKGIEDAVYAVDKANEKYGNNTCCLDIYGQIDNQEISWFESLERNFSKSICYRGVVPFDKSVDVLKEYDALFFPTLFYTEGVPGTIIDAYAAGLPVISSRWESFADVVDDGVTGFGYEFGSRDALYGLVCDLIKNPNLIVEKKKNCIVKAVDYLPGNAMNPLICSLFNT